MVVAGDGRCIVSMGRPPSLAYLALGWGGLAFLALVGVLMEALR